MFDIIFNKHNVDIIIIFFPSVIYRMNGAVSTYLKKKELVL